MQYSHEDEYERNIFPDSITWLAIADDEPILFKAMNDIEDLTIRAGGEDVEGDLIDTFNILDVSAVEYVGHSYQVNLPQIISGLLGFNFYSAMSPRLIGMLKIYYYKDTSIKDDLPKTLKTDEYSAAIIQELRSEL